MLASGAIQLVDAFGDRNDRSWKVAMGIFYMIRARLLIFSTIGLVVVGTLVEVSFLLRGIYLAVMSLKLRKRMQP